jgi:5-methylcytosine-specific restriction endonuclease McrA
MLKPSFHVDHHIPLSDGGSNHIDNLVPLCGTCHAEKTQIENIIRNVEKSKVSKYFSLVNPSPPISDALLKSFRLKKSQHL